MWLLYRTWATIWNAWEFTMVGVINLADGAVDCTSTTRLVQRPFNDRNLDNKLQNI